MSSQFLTKDDSSIVQVTVSKQAMRAIKEYCKDIYALTHEDLGVSEKVYNEIIKIFT